jgi:hypothetical protein
MQNHGNDAEHQEHSTGFDFIKHALQFRLNGANNPRRIEIPQCQHADDNDADPTDMDSHLLHHL